MNSASQTYLSLKAFDATAIGTRWSASEMVFSCFEIVFESFLSLTANPVETRVSKAITPVSGTPISRPTLLKETAGTLDDRRADMTPLVTDVVLAMNLALFYFLTACL